MEKLLKVLIIGAFFNAITWIVLIPLWQYPDEQAHFAQVQNIAENKTFYPKGFNTSKEIAESENILKIERDSLGNNKYTYNPKFNIDYSNSFYGPREKELLDLPKSTRSELVKSEASQNPPLYYITSAQIYNLFKGASLFTRVTAVRFFSVIIYLLTIFVAYKIAIEVFGKKNIAITFVAMVAFMPMFVFANTGIIPDPLVNFLFTAVFYFLIKILKDGMKPKYIQAVFIIFVLGVLTRQHFLIALPIIMLVFLYKFLKSNGIKRFASIFALVVIFLILVEKFGTSYPIISNFRIPDISIIGFGQVSLQSFLDHFVWTLKNTYFQTLPWYWGVYRWLSLTLPHIYYEIINRLLLLSSIGIFLYFYKLIRNKKIFENDKIIIFFATSIVTYFSIFLIWDYFFKLKNNFSFGYQGRYFFPIIIPTFALIFVGFQQIFQYFKKYQNIGFFMLVFLMIIANDFSLFYVASSYYDSSSVNAFILQASQYKPEIIKGNIIAALILASAAAQIVFLFSLGLATLSKKNSPHQQNGQK